MIDDSITNVVAIVLTALFLGLVNSFQFAQTQLPPDALPQFRLPISPSSTTGDAGPLVKPGTIITGALAPLQNWVARLGREHPLVGRIWSTDRQEGVLPTEVVRAAADADMVLIGETHDNPDHHKLQAWLIRELARKGKHPAVVMEMIPSDKADALASYQVASGASADGMATTLGWDSSGWPAWSLYRPIAEAALGANFTVYPGDASKTQIQQVSQGGLGVLSYGERVRLGLGVPFAAALNTALTAEIKTAHCNQLTDNDASQMTFVQRYKDAVLADNLLKAADKSGGGAILIAGGGHIRNDRGVPYYLHTRASGLKVVSILLNEVETGVENPEDAVPRDPNGKAAADFVWFTARSERGDMCLDLQKQLQDKSTGAG